MTAEAAAPELIAPRLAALDPKQPQYVSEVVDALLAGARAAGSSDVHLQPTPDALEIRWRLDGVLHEAARLSAAIAPNVIARLKVLAELLTYRTDVPQEGRIRAAPGALETRVSTFPTLHGEKAVVRLFADPGRYRTLDELGLPAEIAGELVRTLAETSGAVLLAGPAGSGKTTSLYAGLRDLAASTAGARSLATLEDPIEVAVPGVSQSQVNPAAGFTLETGLRSLMRQDPEVIGVGEIRDRATAEVALQAALTGHLVLTTFHAGSAASALGRLLDMGLEPYILRSAIRLIVFQRLARRLCDCARESRDPGDRLGLPVPAVRLPVGCPACRGTGYRGRLVLAEALTPDRGALARAVLDRRDVEALEAAALADGLIPRWQRASDAVAAGLTSPAEVVRVLGLDTLRHRPGPPSLNS